MATQPVPKSADDVLAAANAELDADPDFSGGARDSTPAPPAAEPPAAEPPSAPPPPAVAKPDTTQPAEPPSAPAPTGTPAPPTQTYTKNYLDMVKKFGGDGTGGDADRAAAQRAADHYWETQRQNAELARAPEAEPPSAPPAQQQPQAPAAPAYPAEVTARFDQRMQVLSDLFDANLETVNNLRTEKQKVARELRKLDAYDHENRAKAGERLAELDDEIESLGAKRDSLKQRYDDQKFLSEQAITAYTIVVESQRTREAQNQAHEEVRKEKFFGLWDTTMAEAVKGVPEELKTDFQEFAETEAFRALERKAARNDPSGITPAEAIQAAKEKFLKSYDTYHRLRSKDYATQKINDAKVNAPDGKTAVAPEIKTRDFKSKEELESYLETIDLASA